MASIRDLLLFDDVTPQIQEAQLGSGDTARIKLDSARAFVITDESDVDVLVVNTLTGAITMAGALTMASLGVSGPNPSLDLYDTDCSVARINAQMIAQATDTGDGSEEVDWSVYQQVAGTLERTIFSDADQGIWFYPLGETANPVSITTGGDLNIANKLTHDGDADTYLQFSVDQAKIIVGGATAFNYDEGALNTLAIDQEGTADISFGGGNVFFGGAGGSSDGNVGIGNSSPEAWDTAQTAVQIGGNGAFMADSTQGAGGFFHTVQNAYFDDVNNRWEYISTDEASIYTQGNGEHLFKVVTSGTADNPITWTTALTIANNANIGIETENLATWTSTVSALQVGGTAGLSSQTTQANSTFTLLSQNAYNDGSWKYLSTNVDDQASHIVMVDGSTQFKTAIAGSADSAVTWITQLVLANNSSGLSATFGGDIIVPQGNKVSLNAGGDTYITEFVDNQMRLTVAGTDRVKIDGDGFGGITAGEPLIRARTVATATTPVYSIVGSTGYGLGGAPASNYVSMIANSAEAMRWTETGGVITIEHFGLVADTASAGITASVTQTQGQQPLTARFNQISTVGNANDVVTLASLPASGSISQTVANDGANTLQIFPASGDDLGAGVDTSITLAPGGIFTFRSFNATTWKVV